MANLILTCLSDILAVGDKASGTEASLKPKIWVANPLSSFRVGDGYCFIDIRLRTDARIGILSLQRLSFGLLYVVDECVGRQPSRGGWVFNMGEKRALP